jgi:hypothetical protein
MNLDHSGMRLIRAALSGRCFDAVALLDDQKFLADVILKATEYYSNSELNHDSRTKDEIGLSTLIGELGEHAIIDLCRQAGLAAVHNDEAITGEFGWDVMIEGLKGEIKFQGEGIKDDPKEFFGFSSSAKDLTMRQSWRNLDFIIAFYLKEEGTLVVPWLLLRSEAIDPDKQLYVESQYNSGYFLKMGKARHFYEFLNVTPKEFTA